MTLDEAQKMVAEALEQRRKFGKHFTISDMPPEFLDALVMVHAAPNAREADLAKQVVDQKAYGDAEHEKLILANRQLGAAKSRETLLRKELEQEKRNVQELMKALNEKGG
jgi:hypothetical protein